MSMSESPTVKILGRKKVKREGAKIDHTKSDDDLAAAAAQKKDGKRKIKKRHSGKDWDKFGRDKLVYNEELNGSKTERLDVEQIRRFREELREDAKQLGMRKYPLTTRPRSTMIRDDVDTSHPFPLYPPARLERLDIRDHPHHEPESRSASTTKSDTEGNQSKRVSKERSSTKTKQNSTSSGSIKLKNKKRKKIPKYTSDIKDIKDVKDKDIKDIKDSRSKIKNKDRDGDKDKDKDKDLNSSSYNSDSSTNSLSFNDSNHSSSIDDFTTAYKSSKIAFSSSDHIQTKRPLLKKHSSNPPTLKSKSFPKSKSDLSMKKVKRKKSKTQITTVDPDFYDSPPEVAEPVEEKDDICQLQEMELELSESQIIKDKLTQHRRKMVETFAYDIEQIGKKMNQNNYDTFPLASSTAHHKSVFELWNSPVSKASEESAGSEVEKDERMRDLKDEIKNEIKDEMRKEWKKEKDEDEEVRRLEEIREELERVKRERDEALAKLKLKKERRQQRKSERNSKPHK